MKNPKIHGAVAWEDNLKELKRDRPEVYKALKDPEPLVCLAWNMMETRNKLGLTQKGLADRSGVSLRTISYMERFEAGYNPSVDVIRKIAKALGGLVRGLVSGGGFDPLICNNR